MFQTFLCCIRMIYSISEIIGSMFQKLDINVYFCDSVFQMFDAFFQTSCSIYKISDARFQAFDAMFTASDSMLHAICAMLVAMLAFSAIAIQYCIQCFKSLMQSLNDNLFEGMFQTLDYFISKENLHNYLVLWPLKPLSIACHVLISCELFK